MRDAKDTDDFCPGHEWRGEGRAEGSPPELRRTACPGVIVFYGQQLPRLVDLSGHALSGFQAPAYVLTVRARSNADFELRLFRPHQVDKARGCADQAQRPLQDSFQ